MQKLIIAADAAEADLDAVAAAGWDGVFVGWNAGFDPNITISRIRERALSLQSVHAPFGEIWKLWECEDEIAEEESKRQITCLHDTARMDCDLVIMHAIIGMDRHSPNARGIERFAVLVEEARRLGIRIALENTEGEAYLRALLDAFDAEEHVGFCIDTGHELCYNHARDMIGTYGKRLFGTHLNDNMGITGSCLTWLDDAHMLPFDGAADWAGIVRRLRATGFSGPLTFELNHRNRPGRHTNDRYERMSYAEYLKVAHEHALCVASLMNHA